MKLILKMLIFSLMLINFQLRSQTGKISGVVYNESQDSAIVAAIDVNLIIYKGHNLVDDSSFSVKTDDKGKFEFSSLKTDSTLVYYPTASYKSIVYYGRPARLTEKQNFMQSDVAIYDTTSMADKIIFQLEHLFIDAEAGKLLFREIFIANNIGNKTFIGKNYSQSDKHYVLQFPLPPNFEEVEILTPEAQNWVYIDGGTLYHAELMSPGSRQFSYRFQVPYKKTEWQLSRPISYPIGAVNIFVSNPELTLEGPGVMPQGEFPIRGKSYQRYYVSHIMPGMTLELTIENLPSGTVSVEWIVIIVVVVLLVVGFGYTLKKSKS